MGCPDPVLRWGLGSKPPGRLGPGGDEVAGIPPQPCKHLSTWLEGGVGEMGLAGARSNGRCRAERHVGNAVGTDGVFLGEL